MMLGVLDKNQMPSFSTDRHMLQWARVRAINETNQPMAAKHRDDLSMLEEVVIVAKLDGQKVRELHRQGR
jgi:hypothetical protein